MLPESAIIAVTLNCNGKCIMCNIWKNEISNELNPEEYLKLPSSLREINITGGEPFLREDLDKIVANIKQICPNARLVISSNGSLPRKIESKISAIVKIEPQIALRISIDGLEPTHNKIRGLKFGFKKAIESLQIAKAVGVRDLGISMTVSSLNISDIYDVFRISRELNVEMTIASVSDSDIFFGIIDESLKQFSLIKFREYISQIGKVRLQSTNPKEWARAWFEELLVDFVEKKKRPYDCEAGKSFFYLDSIGNVHGCHIMNSYIGNIKNFTTFIELWRNENRINVYETARKCHKCWMVCTAKTQLRKNWLSVGFKILKKRVLG